MEMSQQLNPICTYKKQVYYVCINPKCKYVCFICYDYRCQCKTLHKQCDKVDWDYITKKLNKQTLQNNDDFQRLSNSLDRIYQSTIRDLNKAYDDFKVWRDNFGLTQFSLSFLKLIQNGRFHELTSEKMYQIRKEIQSSQRILKSQNHLKQKIKSILTDTNKLTQNLKGLYTQKKVAYEQKNKIQTRENLLGDQNERRFFTMNQDIGLKQLEEILEKINQNEESINKNIEGINEKINNIKQKFDRLTDTVNQGKIETNLNRIQHKLINNVNIILNFLKTSPLYVLFQDSVNAISQALTDYSLNRYLQIEEMFAVLKYNLSTNILSSQQFSHQFRRLEKEAQRYRKQIIQKIKQRLRDIKINTISIFFTNKKIKELNLLYKASENNFQISKFWNKCNGKTNTITILKTQFGKIIGGYTPLAWNKSISNYQQDNSKQTFIFSITQKHKIPISRYQQYATYHHASYGPTFGASAGHDLYICNKANVSGSSYGSIGSTYNNGEYTSGSQQSNKKWSGQSSGSSFLIQQWEVYEITFE